jgi:GTP-binding protein
MSAFIDEARLYAKAGDGGNGAVAWRREAHVARGGPAGGDGGDGGDVVFIGEDGTGSLIDYKFKPHLVARNGEPGRGKKQAGHRSEDVVARVPLGTQIFDADTDEFLADVTEHGQRVVICRGGSGGFGNARFATPSRQAPDFANPGTLGEERNLRLSLKLMADVGLLGFPNAGKSTFVASVSAARPKIADYPFTTLAPQLGVVKVPTGAAESPSFVIADIPGLIQGAADGAGLGVRFLKHLERVRVILHLVELPLELIDGAASQRATNTAPAEEDVADSVNADEDGAAVDPGFARGPIDLVERYEALRHELEKFSDELARRPEIVAINKTDLFDGGDAAVLAHPQVKKLLRHLQSKDVKVRLLSGATSGGVDALVLSLWEMVRAEKATPPPGAFDPMANG